MTARGLYKLSYLTFIAAVYFFCQFLGKCLKLSPSDIVTLRNLGVAVAITACFLLVHIVKSSEENILYRLLSPNKGAPPKKSNW